jgi:branched-chain amino acid transport system ATP-binding protein
LIGVKASERASASMDRTQPISKRAKIQALRIIEDEHRSLAAVLHGMLHIVREIRDHGAEPSFDALGAMIYYIDAFPERFHHPKEDGYLFRLLRARYPGAGPLIDRLEEEHRIGAHKIRTLEQALARYQSGGSREFTQFAAAVDDYAEFHWKHMRAEESELMPLAKEQLTAEDWAEIDKAFLGNADPLVGMEAGKEYRALFTRIVNLAPSPIGLGPAARRRDGS